MHLTKRGKRRLLILAALAVVVAMSVAAVFLFRDAYRERLAIKAREDGLAAYRDGDYVEALNKLLYFRQHDRSDVEALLALADSRSRVIEVGNTHLAAAKGLFEEALVLDPDNLQAMRSLLEIYGRIGYRLEAAELIDDLLAIEPDDIDALVAKYLLLLRDLKAGRTVTDDPEPYVQRLIELQPEEINWYKFRLELMLQRNEPIASMIELCDRWIEGYEGDGRFWLLKAELLLGLGRLDEARSATLAAIEHGAASLDVLDLLLSVVDELNRRAGADADVADARRALLERTRQRFAAEPWVYVALIRQQWRNGDFEGGRETIASAREALGPLDDQLTRWDALLAMAAGHREESLSALRQLDELGSGLEPAERDANHAWAEAVRGRLDVETLGWPAVIDRLRAAIALHQRDPILQYLLAESFQRIEEHELAAGVLDRAIRLEPLWVTPYIAAARSLMALGRPDEALSNLFTVLRRKPDADVDTFVLLANAWLASGRPVTQTGLVTDGRGTAHSLVTMLESIEEQTGGRPDLARALVESYLAAGDVDAARTYAERVLADERAGVELLAAVADVAQQAGLPEADRLLDRAMSSGSRPAIAAMRARRLSDAGRIDEGLALLDEAVEDATDDAIRRQAMRARAAYLARHDHPRMHAALASLLDEDPSSHEAALFVLSTAAAWRDQGLIRRAIDQLARTTGDASRRVTIARAQAVLRFEPDDPRQLALALRQISDLLKVTPESLPCLTLMAELLLVGDAADRSGAETYLRRAVDLYPTSWSLYPTLISMLQSRGDFESAEKYLERFARRSDESRSLRLAELKLLEVQGDFETLVLRLRDSGASSASLGDRLALARLNQGTGQFDEAALVYESLLEAAPDSADVARDAADFFALRGDARRALAILEAFDPPDLPAMGSLLLGRFHLRQGDPESARRAYAAALEAAPQDAATIDRVARFHIEIGDFNEALSLTQRGLALDPAHVGLRESKALALLSLGPESRAKALDVIASLGESHAAWLATERLSQQVLAQPSGPTNRDLAEARGLVKSFPQYLPAWRLAVTMHAGAKLPAEAEELARQAIAALPLEPEPLEWRTRLLVERRQPAEALTVARQWRQRSMGDPINADVIIASLLMDLNRHQEALHWIEPHQERIERFAARSPQWLTVWLRGLLWTGQYDRASTLLAGNVTARQLWMSLSRELDVDRARAAMEHVESHRGDEPREAFELASEWARLGRLGANTADLDRAESLAREAETDAGLTLPLLVLRATIATARVDYRQAEECYRQALQLQPGNPGILNNLAYLLLKRDPSSSEALQYSTRAVTLEPNNPNMLDTHARALLGGGRLREAAEYAQRAIDANSGDPTPRLTMARIHIAGGRTAEAAAQLDRAQQLLEAMARRDEALWGELAALRRKLEEQAASASP